MPSSIQKVDGLGRRYTTVPCHAPGDTAHGATGSSWCGIMPPPGRHWRCAPEELEKMDRQGLIACSANKMPRIIKYADAYEGRKIQDVWLNFKNPPCPAYPAEKNMAMLELVVRQSSLPESLVMDCFCGSRSFLAAVFAPGAVPLALIAPMPPLPQPGRSWPGCRCCACEQPPCCMVKPCVGRGIGLSWPLAIHLRRAFQDKRMWHD